MALERNKKMKKGREERRRQINYLRAALEFSFY